MEELKQLATIILVIFGGLVMIAFPTVNAWWWNRGYPEYKQRKAWKRYDTKAMEDLMKFRAYTIAALMYDADVEAWMMSGIGIYSEPAQSLTSGTGMMFFEFAHLPVTEGASYAEAKKDAEDQYAHYRRFHANLPELS